MVGRDTQDGQARLTDWRGEHDLRIDTQWARVSVTTVATEGGDGGEGRLAVVAKSNTTFCFVSSL